MNINQLTRHWSTSRDQFFTPRECFTSFPNIVFDDLMPTITGNEMKVYLAIWRSSWGWKSETCTLSYNQLATAAGVSVSTTIRSIDELEGRGLVTVTRTSTRDIHSSNVYRLNPPPNISPSSEPEPAQAMTAMTAIEPEPSAAGLADTHPTPTGGGDTEPIPPEPIPDEYNPGRVYYTWQHDSFGCVVYDTATSKEQGRAFGKLWMADAGRGMHGFGDTLEKAFADEDEHYRPG